MALSVLDLFSVGIGPSSSHTVGPMRAAKLFADGLKGDGQLASTVRVQAELFGSLGATGRGHGSDKAVVLGLQGLEPETVNTFTADDQVAAAALDAELNVAGSHRVDFNWDEDVVLHRPCDGRIAGVGGFGGGGFVRGVREPGAHGGDGVEVVAAHEGADGAAVGVTADDHVPDAEHLHRVLDGGGLAGRGFGDVGGNDVSRGAQLEQLAGAGARDQGRYDPGVGAGDEEDLGGLSCGQRGELLRALSEHTGVVDEGLHVW